MRGPFPKIATRSPPLALLSFTLVASLPTLTLVVGSPLFCLSEGGTDEESLDDIGVNPANYAGDIPTAYSLNQLKSGSLSYQFDDSQIAWPSDAVSFGPTQYSITQITTPPAWKYYKGQDVSTGWTPSTLASFNPQQDQHFQVWMRTAGLPTFRKLYGKNQDKDLTGKIPWTIAIHSGTNLCRLFLR